MQGSASSQMQEREGTTGKWWEQKGKRSCVPRLQLRDLGLKKHGEPWPEAVQETGSNRFAQKSKQCRQRWKMPEAGLSPEVPSAREAPAWATAVYVPSGVITSQHLEFPTDSIWPFLSQFHVFIQQICIRCFSLLNMVSKARNRLRNTVRVDLYWRVLYIRDF